MDEAKNRENIQKHGIDFADIPKMFDLYMLIEPDDRISYNENRWTGIGLLRNIVAVVIFTERQNDMIRIISARKANKNEQRKYRNAIPY